MRGGSIGINGLGKSYGKQAVVSDVSFEIGAGQFYSLLGPSGSGKTTTLMMIAGFVEPDLGSIKINDQDLTRLSPQHRNLGIVFQNYALFPHLNVEENIAFPLRVRKLPAAEIKERVSWALDAVRLNGFGQRLPAALSGGQQQRVALARAIVFHPPVVLMDEPLGALDKNLRYQMQQEIKEIQQRLGMTVVYVTHDQEEAMNMSDVIVIMNNGRIDQMGPPRKVYEQPASIFAGQFLGEANMISGVLSNAAKGETRMAAGGKLFAAKALVDQTLSGGAKHFVRPEKVRLTSKALKSEKCNSVSGRVTHVSFLGNVVRYSVDIGDQEQLVVDSQNSGLTEHFAVGDEIFANWNISDSLVFHNG